VKLLFDENLSPRLPGLLSEEFPASAHVRAVGLLGSEDSRVWDHARDQGFAIVSKDSDFRQRSFVEGAPPKVIWLNVGNAGTEEIRALLLARRHRISQFEADADESLLVLSTSD
jgi:predicted nuclease of predicted toxin-antitoxin system